MKSRSRSEASDLIGPRFDDALSVTNKADSLSTVRFSQALDKLLISLPTEHDHALAATLLSCPKVADFVVNVAQGIDAACVLRAPRTRIVTNIIKSLEIARRIANHSSDVCNELVVRNLPQIFLPQLDILGNYPCGCVEENICRLIRSMLDFLSEMNLRVSNARAECRSAGGVRIFLALCSAPSEAVRLSATLLLSHIIDEKENDYINATERHLSLLINAFPRYDGSRRFDILRALKTLAAHDRNKDFFARNHFVLLLEEFAAKHASVWTVEEESVVYETLWSLAFDATCREEIGKCSTLMEAVKLAAGTGRCDAVQCNANGVLWKMKETDAKANKEGNTLVTDGYDDDDEGEDDEEEDDEEDKGSSDDVEDDDDDDVVDSVLDAHSHPLPAKTDGGFVLLIFTQSAQGIFGRLHETLKKAGYDTLSRCSLRDASIQSMARTVEEATAIVFEVSASGKCCAWFREVLEMSHRLQKPLIPLLLESGYMADGWLGFVCGSSLVYDMFEDGHLDANAGKIFMELSRRGKKCCGHSKPSEVDGAARQEFCRRCAFEVRHLSTVEKTMEAPPAENHVVRGHRVPEIPKPSPVKRPAELPSPTWTPEQVGQWLHHLGIPNAVRDRLVANGLDGSLLLTWYGMLTEAPNAFYRTAQQELSLGLTDTLRLTRGLRCFVEGPGKAVVWPSNMAAGPETAVAAKDVC